MGERDIAREDREQNDDEGRMGMKPASEGEARSGQWLNKGYGILASRR